MGKHKPSEQYPHISVGKRPVAIDADIDKIYVVNQEEGTVSVINGDNNTVVNTISIGYKPTSIATNFKNSIYVGGSDTVSVIDTGNNTVVNTIKVGNLPYDLDIDIFNNAIYVANAGDGTISVIDRDVNKVVSKVMFNIEPFNAGHIECDKDKSIAPIAQQF